MPNKGYSSYTFWVQQGLSGINKNKSVLIYIKEKLPEIPEKIVKGNNNFKITYKWSTIRLTANFSTTIKARSK